MEYIKKIGKKELEEITCEDVYRAIDRWDSNEDLEVKQRKYDSKDYYFYI